MRAIIQRVLSASVETDKKVVGSIKKGYMILLGISKEDGEKELKWICDKIKNIRIFSDIEGKMNLSLNDVQGEILLISQFTLYADCIKGRRPGFTEAAGGEKAEKLYIGASEYLKNEGIKVEMGIFGADMQITLINDGPVTIILDTKDAKL